MSNLQKGTSDQREIGKHIRDARKKLNLTQERLAEKVGVERNTVHRYEKGQGGNMSTDVFFKFAEALGMTLTELGPSRFQTADAAAMQVVYDAYQQLGPERFNRFAQTLKDLFDEPNK